MLFYHYTSIVNNVTIEKTLLIFVEKEKIKF